MDRAGLLIGGLVIFVAWAAVQAEVAHGLGWLIVGLVGTPFLLLGLAIYFTRARERVTLTAHSIEVRGAFRTRLLRRDNIVGWRRREKRGLTLHTEGDREGGVAVPSYVARDSQFEAWLAGIPDLEQHDLRDSEERYYRESSVPGSTVEKQQHLDSARGTAKVLLGAGVVIALWLSLYPWPYLLAVITAMAMPLLVLGVAITGRGAYSLETKQNDVRASLVFPLGVPIGALFLHASSQLHVFDGDGLFVPTLVVMAVLTGAFVLLDGSVRRSWRAVVPVALLMGAYGYGTVKIGNRQLDAHTSSDRVMEVFRRWSVEKNQGPYRLELVLPGEGHGSIYEVNRRLYDRVVSGDTVCLIEGEGALGVRWYEVEPCPRAER